MRKAQSRRSDTDCVCETGALCFLTRSEYTYRKFNPARLRRNVYENNTRTRYRLGYRTYDQWTDLPIEVFGNTPVRGRQDKPAEPPKPAQPQCQLTLAQSPIVRRLKLGMTEADASAVTDSTFGSTAFSDGLVRELATTTAKLAGFENVRFLHLHSFQGKVFRIALDYDQSWSNLSEFVENFAPKLGLPMTGWTAPYSSQAELRCKDFLVELEFSMDSSLTLTEIDAVTFLTR